ncbi:type III secretion system inner rod subunit SctI [Enterobacter asburiae]|uniref:type III secretion system inner rod subunit SctI n=1 Tax=Enterobacter asburiae TaxID=61645 RepID=UPI0020046F25|nr:type III secretion system inner rod subunit SctI [Enterobacter asburiae]MCK7227229.1 type III secretion system inner rod subunit SctI [Enterobacter asburiae]
MDAVTAPATIQSFSANDKTVMNMPDVKAINEFKSAMAQVQAKPEISLVNAVSQQQALFGQTLQGIQPVVQTGMGQPATPDADKALDAQYALFNLTFNLDMTAKVAGQFSQAVNKLVSMQ